jgi:DNA-binding response OmpR family regulator
VEKHILLIDDEDDIREVTALSIETVAGWRVSTANSGATGVRKAAEERPDAILLDVMMPQMDGHSTFKALQENSATAGIPVIFLTAKMRGDGRTPAADGAAGTISKPFDPLTLAAQVRSLLRWSTDES